MKFQPLPEFKQVPKCPESEALKCVLPSESSLRAPWTSLSPRGLFSDARRTLDAALAFPSGMT